MRFLKHSIRRQPFPPASRSPAEPTIVTSFLRILATRASAWVLVASDDRESMFLGKIGNCSRLVNQRYFLGIARHSEVFGCGNWNCDWHRNHSSLHGAFLSCWNFPQSADLTL